MESFTRQNWIKRQRQLLKLEMNAQLDHNKTTIKKSPNKKNKNEANDCSPNHEESLILKEIGISLSEDEDYNLDYLCEMLCKHKPTTSKTKDDLDGLCRSTFRTLHDTLDCIELNNLIQDTRLFSVLMREKRPRKAKISEMTLINKNLDQSQRAAVQLTLDRSDLAVIHGPPGTGKTTVLIEVIQQHLQRDNIMLVCAPSNAAVDNIAKKLLEKHLPFIRLGNSPKIHKSVVPHTLKNIYHKSPYCTKLRKWIRELKIRDKPEEFIKSERKRLYKLYCSLVIKRYNIVLCTLIVSNTNGPIQHLQNHFTVVIIDECAQAMEAACYVPAILAPKLILAGDDQQLPPTIISPLAARLGLSESMMERIIKTLSKNVVAMLTTQYRMNSLIMKWSSDTFYNGVLKAHSSVAHHTLFPLINKRNTSGGESVITALQYIDTKGSCPENKEKDGCFNIEEAEIVLEEIGYFIHLGVKQSDIAVISPYRKQVSLISNRIKATWQGIKVDTVDAFQGSEKEVIILSLVRSNKSGKIGFLKDTRRLNVAVTRARRCLIVIGDMTTLSKDQKLKTFVKYLKANASLISYENKNKDEDLCQEFNEKLKIV